MRPHSFSLALLLATTLSSPLSAGTADPASLWPHPDGMSWTYAQHTEEFLPPLAPVDRAVRTILDGTMITPGGFEAQFFVGQLLSGPLGASAGSDATGGLDPFLRRLYAARPGLRGAILARAARVPCQLFPAPGFDAVLLSPNGALVVSPTDASAWRCDVPNLRAWEWLTSDLDVGDSFTLQLIPDLASDVFLHGTVGAVEPVTVPAGTFAGCVRVDYVVDYGLFDCTDPEGNPGGPVHAETRGSIHWAPGVGPVRVFEEFIPYVGGTNGCAPDGWADEVGVRVTMDLIAQPVPVAATSWGKLKLRYR